MWTVVLTHLTQHGSAITGCLLAQFTGGVVELLPTGPPALLGMR